MKKAPQEFKAIISSDWSECLSPAGPFDFIEFSYPQLAPALSEIFRGYTGNRISLGDACRRIQAILPAPVTQEMMDAYIESSGAAYRGVPELIEWCLSHGILFMINTTAMIGYFQRVFAKGLLPRVPVLSANALFRFPPAASDPEEILEISETADKGKNTQAVVQRCAIPAARVVVMGDSGGDGPHFEWGRKAGAFTIGSMTKPSLSTYCGERGIVINLRVGVSYAQGEARDVDKEKRFDFMSLVEPLQSILKR
jgi:phosphoglycolate phosphatase-like HAD superfamily hydrolase